MANAAGLQVARLLTLIETRLRPGFSWELGQVAEVE